MTGTKVGFVGLGNIGGPMAANLVRAGNPLWVFDSAGTTGRAPEGAECAESCAAVAHAVNIVILSLPDDSIVESVCGELASASPRSLSTIIDTSTIGIPAAQRIAEQMNRAGIEYIDAPVSGGVAGAKAGTVAVMFAGPKASYRRLGPLLNQMARQVFHVGTKAGCGQAMKLLNNFLSATAMAATSEALAFGECQGLDLATMLEVLNVSTGQNTATADKFPNRVLTGSYDAGFRVDQFNKDLNLYASAVADSGAAAPVSPCVLDLWQRMYAQAPEEDMTRVYTFVRDGL